MTSLLDRDRDFLQQELLAYETEHGAIGLYGAASLSTGCTGDCYGTCEGTTSCICGGSCSGTCVGSTK